MDIREIPKIIEITKKSEIVKNSKLSENSEWSKNFANPIFERRKIFLTPHLKQKMNHDVEMDIERIEFCQELLQEIIHTAVGNLFLFIIIILLHFICLLLYRTTYHKIRHYNVRLLFKPFIEIN